MRKQQLAGMILQSAQTYAAESAMRIKIDGQWHRAATRKWATLSPIARALLASGVEPGDRIGIFSQNRPEWSLLDLAILAIRAVSVPIYATNTRDQAAYIIDDTAMSIIFTGDQENYDKIQASLAQSPSLKQVIAIDDDAEISGDAAQHFSQFLALGADKEKDAEIDARLAEARQMIWLLSSTPPAQPANQRASCSHTATFYTNSKRCRGSSMWVPATARCAFYL